MTKEEFLEKFRNAEFWEDANNLVDEFFKDKVIIQRGENRHPYADVFHVWVEGVDCEWKNRITTWKPFEWGEDFVEYRIKPKEPIYEWQWYDIDRNTEVFMVNSGKFMTEDEAGELTTFGFMRKFEETKRERR